MPNQTIHGKRSSKEKSSIFFFLYHFLDVLVGTEIACLYAGEGITHTSDTTPFQAIDSSSPQTLCFLCFTSYFPSLNFSLFPNFFCIHINY